MATATIHMRALGAPRPQPTATGRRLLAAATIAQPALLMLNAWFHPEVDMTAQSVLDAALDAPTTWYVVHTVAALGAALGLPAAWAIRTLAPTRGRALANAGVTLMAIAAGVLVAAFAVEATLVHLAATELEPAHGRALVEAYADRPEFFAVGVGAMAATLGGLLLAGALRRAGTVDPWPPTAYMVGVLATAVGPPGTVIGPLGFATVTVASVFLARSIVAPRATPAASPAT